MKTTAKIALLILLNTLTALSVFSQNLNITIKDAEKNTLPGATLQLTNISDSVSKFTTSDYKGVAKFENIKNGLYSIKITFVGYSPFEKTISIKSDQRVFEFVMHQNAIALSEFSVVAKRPLIRQEDDKMIIDPEPLIDISSNTLEVLESTPGIFVDQDGGIFVNGASPAAVYINGREQKMSNQDLTNLLRSLPPSSIEKIEVLRTPSTKYDAASSGGIVNIVLKKGVKIGRFGSVNTGMNQGTFGNRFAGFSINNSGSKSSMYLNANFNYHSMLEELKSQRILVSDSTLNQFAENISKSNNLYIGYGINYDLKENLNLSYDGRINLSRRNSESENTNVIKKLNEELFKSENTNNNNFDNFSIQQDLGLKLKIDTLGSEWDNKFSFSINEGNSDLEFNTNIIYPINLSQESRSDNEQNRIFLQFQSDLTYRLPHKIKLETGLKSTYQNFVSESKYYRTTNNTNELISNLSNSFNYNERINSAYAQASKTLWEDFVLKTGVRMEHTYMQGNQTNPKDTSFAVNRVDFFPYAFLSRKIFSISTFELKAFMIYRRTINRPGYQSLNPYIRYVDEFLYETGNPALKPQFTDNFEINISFDDTPLFAIGRSYTTDIFTNVVYRDEENSNVAIRTFDNLGKNTETYFRAMAGIPPGKKYFFAIGTQYSFLEYDGLYEGDEFSFTRGSWRFFTFHSLNLDKETKLTLSGFMMQNGLYNFYELDTFGQINLGINRTFFKKKLSISLNARDILGTMKTNFELNQSGLTTTGSRYTDSRRFGINIRYNFGLKKKEDRSDFMKFDIEN